MRTHHCGPPERLGKFLKRSRATGFSAGTTLSSRAKKIASASLSSAFMIFFSLSAGTNSQERGSGIGLLQQQRGAGAFAYQFIALVVAAMGPGHDPGIGARLALAHGDALGLAAQGVAGEHGLGKD